MQARATAGRRRCGGHADRRGCAKRRGAPRCSGLSLRIADGADRAVAARWRFFRDWTPGLPAAWAEDAEAVRGGRGGRAAVQPARPVSLARRARRSGETRGGHGRDRHPREDVSSRSSIGRVSPSGRRRGGAADRRTAAAFRRRRRYLQEHLHRMSPGGRQGQGKDRAEPGGVAVCHGIRRGCRDAGYSSPARKARSG